jgi:four helix bundle protein
MEFDHERLHVYRLALEFLAFAEQLIAALPKGRSHLADQLSRASLSIVLNVAEGAGKVSAADKRRYYVSARGSATESAALLDVCFQLKLIAEEQHRTGKEILWRIVAMLVKLARSLEKH